MIYLIDDKISRQKGYGWTDEEFENFKGVIIRVVGEDNLIEFLHQIIAPGNVILIHDSFLNGKSDVFDKFKSTNLLVELN